MENRREFIKILSALPLGIMAGSNGVIAAENIVSDRFGDLLPLRPLGKTGKLVTMLGMGGFHIGCAMSEKEAIKTVEVAIEGGVRFFDCAKYCGGETEYRLGRILTPKYREVVYLMSKTLATDGKLARQHLDESLKALNTDYLDCGRFIA
jgi:aryl-alcohol dehydrogenase-like predicted oxidoreductase